MPRIRKGNNLLAKGHVQVHSAFAAGIGSGLKQGLPPGGGGVDYKSVFESIRNRVTGTSSSEGTVQAPGGHYVSGPRENGTGATCPARTTDVDLLESGVRDGRGEVGSAAAVKLGPSAGHTAVEVEGKQDRKDATTPPATIRGREVSSAQQASDDLRHLIKDTTATILSLCASAVPGYSRAHDSRASSVKRGRQSEPVDLNVMAQAEDDSQSPPRRSSGPEIISSPDDGGKVPFVKRRKVEGNEISGTQVKEADAAGNQADAAGKQADAAGISGGKGGWSCDSRLSPHLKRPRTPHHSRSFGTTGRFSKKKPRILHVSTAGRLWEDAFGRKDEAEHAATVSPSEQGQLGGPHKAAADVTRMPAVAQSRDATPVEKRDAEELFVEMGPVHVVTLGVDHDNDGRDLDHPSNKPVGSLLHSLYLAFQEAGCRGLTVRDAVLIVGNKDVPELGALSAAEVRKELQLSPYFIEVEEGRFFLCSSLPEKGNGEESPSAGYGHSPHEVKGASVVNGMEKLQVHSYREGCPFGGSAESEHQNKQEESLTPRGMSQGSLQEYLDQQRNSKLLWERVTRDNGIQYKSEGSYDSETTENADSENDADFDVRAESSGATTLTDGHLSSDDERIVSQELPHTVKRPVRRAAPAGDSATARENRYRHLLDSLTEEDKRSSGGRQCARTDGRRWQCPLRAKGAYSLCEHHLSKFRMKKAYAALKRRAVVEGSIPDRKRSRSTSCPSASASPALPPNYSVLPPNHPALPPNPPALPPNSPALPPTSPALPPNSLSQQRSAEEYSDPGRDQDTGNVGYSSHLNSRGHRKTVKNRSLMSMY